MRSRRRIITSESKKLIQSALRPLRPPQTRLKPSSYSPLSPLRSSSASSSLIEENVSIQAKPSLARLPLDVLHLIGKYVEPSIAPVSAVEGGGAASSSTSWIDYGKDLYNLSSTCKSIYQATRPLTFKTYGFHRLDSTEEGETLAAVKRLGAIKTKKGAGNEQAVEASKIRHFYFRINFSSSFFLQHGPFLVKSLRLMSNLESVAVIYTNEDRVVQTSPYSVAVLPQPLIQTLSNLPNLRELYLCGVKITNFRDPIEVERCRFSSRFKTLVLNACHDVVLLLLPLAPSATHLSIWRDFAHHPRVDSTAWWKEGMWNSVEYLQLYGFSGQQGRSFLQTWVDSLYTRQLDYNSPSTRLRTLSLPEPYLLFVFLSEILPSLARLPHLRSFTILIWNDRTFNPTILSALHSSSPNLEELGFGLDSEKPQWWKGDLSSWGLHLAKFDKLETLTWNYSPYSDLSFPDLRKYVTRPLHRGICSTHPSLRSVKWFGAEMEWRKSDDGEGVWNWKDEGLTLNEMESIRIERENGGEEEGKFTILEDDQEEKDDGQGYLIPYAERKSETGGIDKEEKAKEEEELNKENEGAGGIQRAQALDQKEFEGGKNLAQVFRTVLEQDDHKPVRQKKVRFAEDLEDSGFFG
ncbi:hypothetical protein JCM3765_002217 [Sporobolomyces pararoseus]